MRPHSYGVWVLCQTKYNELIVIQKSDYDQWGTVYPKDYTFIAEGTRPAMKLIQKLMKESTC